MCQRSRSFACQFLSFLALSAGCLTISASDLLAQEMPEPDGDAIEGGFFQTEGPDGEVTLRSAQGNTFQKKTMRLPAGYRSPTLRATFLAQWMYIIQRGQKVTFWGARIIKMAPDSPLRALSLRPGDVITRLDGVPIWTDMFRTGPGQPFQLPNLEEHFGGTEVRYIAQGTNRVRVGQINIDTEEPEDDGIAPIRP